MVKKWFNSPAILFSISLLMGMGGYFFENFQHNDSNYLERISKLEASMVDEKDYMNDRIGDMKRGLDTINNKVDKITNLMIEWDKWKKQ